MGRIARAEEVAAVTAFLLSDEAPYLSGESIAVDGAWTASFGDVDVDPALAAPVPAGVSAGGRHGRLSGGSRRRRAESGSGTRWE